jgi:hypothetical protein
VEGKVKNKNKLFFLSVIGLAVCSTIAVAELSGTEVMQRVQDQANYHHTKTSVVSMQIVNKKKKKRYRVFKSFSKYKPEVAQNRSLLKFYEPANVSGVALLSIRDDQKSTNTNTTSQWVYFPAFKSIKQIVGSQKNDSFMGSDFTYDDMSGRAISRDTHTILETDASHTIVKSVPVDSNDAYTYIISKINTATWVPEQIIFFNSDSKSSNGIRKFKTLFYDTVQLINGGYIVTQSTMVNHERGSYTQLSLSDIQTNVPLSDNDVGRQSLK